MKLLQLFQQHRADASLFDEFLSLKSQNTVRNYKSILRAFFEFTEGRFANADCLRWAEYELKQPGETPRRPTSAPSTCTEATVLHKAYVIKGYLKYCRVDTSGIEAVCNRLKKAETGSKRETEALSPEEVEHILSTWVGNTSEIIKNGALLGLLFGGGLRISEVCDLRVGDILEGQDGLCWASLRKTKSKKRRDQVLPEWAAKLVHRWINIVGEKKKESYLFSSVDGEKSVDQTTVRRWFSKIIKEAKLPQNFYSPHSARATAITQLLRQGSDYNQVRIFAGHSSFLQVARYDKRLKSHIEHVGLTLTYKK